MSADATGWVYRYSPYTGTVFQVHLAVADSVNDMHHQEFWMALDKLATKARCSVRSVRDAMHQLVEDGWLDLLHQSEGRHPSKYRFRFAEVAVVYESRNGNPAEVAGNPATENPAMEPGSGSRVTRQQLPSNPAAVAGQPNQIPSRSQKRERAQKKTAWHTLPDAELLTPERRELAREAGLHPARTAGEWRKFSMYYFPKPKVDVDATWRNWVVRALDEPWSPPADPKPHLRAVPDEPGQPERLGGVVGRVLSEAEKTKRMLDARDRAAEAKDRATRENDVGL